MITEILKTLSDGEIMSIAKQLNDPNVDEQLVYKQLVSKGNEDKNIDEMFDEMNSDNFRGTLPRLVSVELASRLNSIISSF